jgi:hypothetical protein
MNNKYQLTFEEVKSKLLELYRRSRAGKLAAFWLYVQELGSQDARETFGEKYYQLLKLYLNKAGVELVEPSKGVIHVDRNFFKTYRLERPSHLAVNEVAATPSRNNILNFRPRDQKSDRTD